MAKYLIENKLPYLALYFSIITLFSCTALNNVNHITSNNVTNRVEQKDAIEEIAFKLKSFIANKYYDFDKKRIISVFLKRVSSNYYEEPLFSGYIYDCIAKKLKEAAQFALVSSTNPHLDSIIDIHVIKDEHGNIRMLLNVIVPKDNTVIYTNISSYNKDDFDLKNYLTYKKNEPQKSEKESAYLTIKAINIGSSYKEEDKYYLHTRYMGGIIDQYISKEDTGSSGYYPAEQKCIINGKIFIMDTNTIFYKNNISPGKIELIASFRGGRWDAYNKQQTLRSNYSKKFYVNIKRNDNIIIDIFFIYHGNEKNIKVKAKRIKQFEKNKSIEEHYEIIDVFSD